jgi:hypothetical protein
MKKLRLFVALVGGIALFLMTGAPSNASTTMTTTCTPTTHSSNATCQGFQDYGNTVKPNVVTTHLPAGWEIARSVGTSVITPIPNNGDVVGSVDGYGDLFTDGCGNPTHQTYTVKWKSPVDSSAPTGTVAEMVATATPLGITITVNTYVILSSGDSFVSGSHYNVQTTMPSAFYCANQPMQQTTTVDGTVSGSSPTRVIQRLPTTAGTYTTYDSWTDTNSGNHSDSATISIT